MSSNRVAEERKKQGLSQLRLSYLTGIQPTEISRIETGRIRPYRGWRQRIAKALKVSEAELFGDDGKD